MNKGFIFLEILIAVALIGIVFITLLGIGFSAVNISTAIKKQTQADSLIKEEFEALRSYRDGTTWTSTVDPIGLGKVNTGSSYSYYLLLNANKWNLTSGTETVDIFTRKVIFDKVSRDPATQNIESTYNASHDDPDAVKTTITIAWLNKTSQVVAYFTNWNR